MPRLFAALPVPEEIADELSALQSGVPDARWVPAENFHVTLCFAGEVQGATMRDLEEELALGGADDPVRRDDPDRELERDQPQPIGAERLADGAEARLAAMGHKVKVAPEPLGGSQMVMRDAAGTWTAGSDPRKDGCALGY